MGSCLGRNKQLNTSDRYSLKSSCLRADIDEIQWSANYDKSCSMANLIYSIFNFPQKKTKFQLPEKNHSRHQDANYRKLINSFECQERMSHLNEKLINTSQSIISPRLDLDWDHDFNPIEYVKISTLNIFNLEESSLYNFEKQIKKSLFSSITSISSLTQSAIFSSNNSNKVFNQAYLKYSIESEPVSKKHSQLINTLTCNSSYISNCDSMEWDVDEEQRTHLNFEDDNFGDDALKLLYQIEQLKMRSLKETGYNLYTDYTKFNREDNSDCDESIFTNRIQLTYNDTYYSHYIDSDYENSNHS